MDGYRGKTKRMNRDLRIAIEAGDGVAARDELLRAVPRHVLEHAVRAGQLTLAFPRTYVDSDRLAQPWTRARAALTYAGPASALSHLTALAAWRLPAGDLTGPTHVTVPRQRRLQATRQIVVHRRCGFVAAVPEVVVRGGLPTTQVERSVVDGWSVLPRQTRRAPVIAAVGDRRTTPERLCGTVATNLSLPGRAELLRLLNLLDRGCRSELELWGYEHVFAGPDMPNLERNVPVRLGNRTVYLDTYCRAARVNVELDGAAWRTSPADRERDARRDAALASIGIMVVRFTHNQLIGSPEQVRAQVRAIVAAAEQIGIGRMGGGR